MSGEEREALMARMRSAATLSEVDAALEEARTWLRDHPGDDQVTAAMQRLEERGEQLRDPEKTPNWASLVVFVVVAVAVWAVVYVLSGGWALSVLAGVVLGMEVAWWTWETTLAFVENARRSRRGR